jgi:hypothetical protein
VASTTRQRPDDGAEYTREGPAPRNSESGLDSASRPAPAGARRRPRMKCITARDPIDTVVVLELTN